MTKLIIGGIAAAALAAGIVTAGPAHAAAAVCAPGVVAVGPTSCAFAIDTAIAYVNRTGGVIGSAQLFSVYSPATDWYYDMTCAPGGYRTVVCRGGNNAEVVLS